MMQRWAVILLLGLVASAPAQLKPKMNAPGPLPEKLNFGLDKTEPKVLVAAADCLPVDYPGPDAKVMPNYRDGKAKLGFKEGLHYIDQIQQGDSKFRLLVRKDPTSPKITEHVGWVNERLLITKMEAVLDLNTNIHLKAFLANRPAALKAVDEKDALAVPVFFAPDDKAKRGEPLRLLQQLFIWADSNPGNEKEGYYLLGSASSLLDWDDTKVIIGWVPKSRVCVWNTREGFVWHTPSTQEGASPRRTTPAAVYHKPEDAHQVWKAGPKGEAVSYLFRERLGAADPTHDSKDVPFLLLPWPSRESDQKLAEYEAHRQKHQTSPDKKSKLRHVGVYAGIKDAEGNVLVEAEKVDQLKKKLNQILEEASTLEVLIVLDATSSMRPYGEAVANLIDQLIKDSTRPRAGLKGLTSTTGEKLTRLKFRLAVSYYRDIDNAGVDPYTCVEANPLKDFGESYATALSKQLRESGRYRDGWDAPEQSFRGVMRSIEKAQFKEYSRKVVVLIGDMGNNTKWDRGEFQNAPTVDDIAQALNPKDRSPLLFFPFQVNVNPDQPAMMAGLTNGEKLAAAAFKKESQAILAASGKLRQSNPLVHPEIPAGKYLCTSRDTKTLITALNEPLAVLLKQQAEIEQQITNLSLGRFNAEIGPELQRILKLEGVDLEALRKLKGAQVFETGYLWENAPNGAPQIARRILVSESDLEEIIRGLAKLRTRDPGAGSLKSLIIQLVKTQAGEKELVGDLLFGSLKGVTFKSPLLQKAVKTFEENKIDVDERRRLLLLREKLEDLFRGLSYTDDQYVKIDGEPLKWGREGKPVELKGKLQRWFYLGGDKKGAFKDETTKWYWLDYDKEWP